jgi:serine/threonine protein kinase
VLPASFSDDADRVARFEQEAKTLAALNHPNIAHIYGIARGDGAMGLVMELIDGPTLADRIAARGHDGRFDSCRHATDSTRFDPLAMPFFRPTDLSDDDHEALGAYLARKRD